VPAFYLMKYKRYLITAGFFLLTALYWFLEQPCLFITTEDRQIAKMPVRSGLPVSIHFVHSVQKTPVDEFLVVNQDKNGFILNSTRYQSFGVGLPFMENDGGFRREGEYFIMDNMDRRFERLSVRPGVGTQLTLTVDGKKYPLYKDVPLGTKVDLYMAPRYKSFLRKE